MKFHMIKNWDELAIDEGHEVALELLEAGLRAADPKTAVKNNVSLDGCILKIQNVDFDLSRYGNILVVGAGKASGSMAEAIEEILGERITAGLVIVPRGTSDKYHVKKIELWEGDHPVPSEQGRKGAEKIISLLERYKKEDTLVIALFSGGGSALMPLPPKEITLNDKQVATIELLKCGASIDEVNTVRKHLSLLKGGRLAAAAYPSTVIGLFMSDVVGDRLDTIASGPTAPDPTTFADALKIIEKYGLENRVPGRVLSYLKKGSKGVYPESPKPNDSVFGKVHNFIVASNRTSLKIMARRAKELGLNTIILTSLIEGEARHVGRVLAAILKEIRESGLPLKPPAVIIAGGETTVTVVGSGKGGRNQELALSAAISLKNSRGIVLASMGSDGIDGITDAAGAIVDSETFTRALNKGVNPQEYLANNDSYNFFRKVGGLIYTGYTGTNVNDLCVGVVLK